MLFRILILVFVLSSCVSDKNSYHALFQNKTKTEAAYARMSKSRYEEIYHAHQKLKYPSGHSSSYQFIDHESQWKDLNLTWPTTGILTSVYGPRTLRHKTRMHEGIDIGAQVGTPVYAAETGRVVLSGKIRGYGNSIILKHDSKHDTLYGHLSRIIVKSNQIVHKNQLIGYVGRTGRVTGANLHFEMRVNGIAKDPLKFLPGALTGRNHIRVGDMIIADSGRQVATDVILSNHSKG